MNKKYIDGMNEVKAYAELKEKIKNSINQNTDMKKPRFFSYKKAAAVVAFACALTLFMTFGIPLKQKDNDSAKQGTNDTQILFNGFVIMAHAADGSEIEVKPEVEFLLGQYQMTMSSVPGFPVKIACAEADTIKLTVTDGEFLLWAPPDYKVYNKGKELEIKSGDKIYWSPMNIEDNSIATKCTLEISAYKNGKEIGGNAIEIEADESYTFTGKLIQ